VVDSGKLAMAAFLIAVGAAVWFALIRRGPELTAFGTILRKGYLSPTTYIQQPVEVNRSFRTPREIPIAESYSFELRLDGVTDPVRASFNTVKSRQFEVGQKVRVQYVRRGIPPLWHRITVLDMTPVEPH
jgi:hypothetical protein